MRRRRWRSAGIPTSAEQADDEKEEPEDQQVFSGGLTQELTSQNQLLRAIHFPIPTGIFLHAANQNAPSHRNKETSCDCVNIAHVHGKAFRGREAGGGEKISGQRSQDSSQECEEASAAEVVKKPHYWYRPELIGYTKAHSSTTVPPLAVAGDGATRPLLEANRDALPGMERPDAFVGTNVFVLFDTSNFMYRGFVYAEDAIADFVRGLDRADSVAVYTFSRNLSRAAPLTHDHFNAIAGLRKSVAGACSWRYAMPPRSPAAR